MQSKKAVSSGLINLIDRMISILYVCLLLLLLLADKVLSLWNDSCSHYNYRQIEYDQRGMHILCVKPNDDNTINISVLINGSFERQFHYAKDYGECYDLLAYLYDEIGTSNNRQVDDWGLFNYEGQVVWSIARMAYEETTFVFTNGIWMFPGVRVGYEQYAFDGKRNIKVTTLSLRPLVLRAYNFLGSAECEHIINKSEPEMLPSPTVKMDQDVDLPDTTWRTSTQHFLHSEGDDIITAIDTRTAKMTRTRKSMQEPVQVLRYKPGEKYDQHTDYFDARYYQNDPKTLDLIRNGEKNRLITVLWYMTNVTVGGETIFPKAFGGKGQPLEDGTTNCDDRPDALKVKPVQGDVIIFYSLYADGYIDKHSLHAACPVGPNEIKYAANKWVWNADV